MANAFLSHFHFFKSILDANQSYHQKSSVSLSSHMYLWLTLSLILMTPIEGICLLKCSFLTKFLL